MDPEVDGVDEEQGAGVAGQHPQRTVVVRDPRLDPHGARAHVAQPEQRLALGGGVPERPGLGQRLGEQPVHSRHRAVA